MKRLLSVLLLFACLPVHAAFINACSDAEAVRWQSQVLTNGGSLSAAGYVAGTRFLIQAKIWGVRPLLKRVNLDVGNNTNAALVPIIREWWSGTGDDVDSAVAFVAADFNESSGWTGDGTTKYRIPNGNAVGGVQVSGLTTSTNLHLALYVRSGSNESAYSIGVQNNTPFPTAGLPVSYGGSSYITIGTNLVGTTDANGVGCYLSTRRSTTNASLYKNGVALLDSSTSDTAGLPTGIIYVNAINLTYFGPSPTSRTLSYYGIGVAVPATLAKPYYDCVQNVQLTMGRAK